MLGKLVRRLGWTMIILALLAWVVLLLYAAVIWVAGGAADTAKLAFWTAFLAVPVSISAVFVRFEPNKSADSARAGSGPERSEAISVAAEPVAAAAPTGHAEGGSTTARTSPPGPGGMGRPVLARFGVPAGALGIIVLMIMFMVFYDRFTGIAYQSGSEPTEITYPERSCVSTACPIGYEFDDYEWVIRSNGDLDTAFIPMDASLAPDRLLGELKSVSSCGGTQINWVIRANDGAPVAEGTLDGSATQELDAAIPSDTRKITITARRTDGQPCPVTLQWLDPELRDARP